MKGVGLVSGRSTIQFPTPCNPTAAVDQPAFGQPLVRRRSIPLLFLVRPTLLLHYIEHGMRHFDPGQACFSGNFCQLNSFQAGLGLRDPICEIIDTSAGEIGIRSEEGKAHVVPPAH